MVLLFCVAKVNKRQWFLVAWLQYLCDIRCIQFGESENILQVLIFDWINNGSDCFYCLKQSAISILKCQLITMISIVNCMNGAVKLKLFSLLWILVLPTNALDTMNAITVAPLTADNPVSNEKLLDSKDYKKFDSDPPPEYYK